LRAPQNFISALSQSLPIIGLTAGFGPESAGQFAIALAIAGAPIMLIGNATQTVLYPRLTAAVQDNEDTSRLFLSSTLGLLAIGSPIFVLIAMFGPSFFEILLGTPWREAGVYCALLVPWLWLGLANRPAVALIPALKLQRGLLIYEIIVTLAKMGTILIGLHVLESARWTVGMFSGVGAFAYSILIFWVYWSSRKKVG
jgi:O-antigen/teichoic acid export membrane protein